MSSGTGPIFVLGCGRSGTTLLRLMLNSHPRIAIPGETWFFPDLHADRNIVCAWAESDWRDRLTERITGIATFGELGVSAGDLREQLEVLSRNDWPSVIALANLAFAHKEGKPRWGDKTPGYVRCLPLIKELFPDATILHIIRDGRDVALSFLDQSFGPTGILEGADYWREDVERGQRDGPRAFGASYHEVRYEALVADPTGVLTAVCEVIGESYDPAMLTYHGSAQRYLQEQHSWHDQTKSAPDRGRLQRWQKEMRREDEALFELAAGPLLAKLGYPVTRNRSVGAYRSWLSTRLAHFGSSSLRRIKAIAYRLTQRT